MPPLTVRLECLGNVGPLPKFVAGLMDDIISVFYVIQLFKISPS